MTHLVNEHSSLLQKPSPLFTTVAKVGPANLGQNLFTTYQYPFAAAASTQNENCNALK